MVPELVMEKSNHHFPELFAQLGLPNDADSIANFLALHAPIPASEKLIDAPFWSASQASFLRESLGQDSDWSNIVDQLNKALHIASVHAQKLQ